MLVNGPFGRIIALGVFVCVVSGPSDAADKDKAKKAEEPVKVLGVSVNPHQGRYLVLKDANVRARPKTKSKRVARLKAGDHVFAVGRVKGPWIAVREKELPIGFVYGPILMPLIDGALADVLTGSMETTDRHCDYKIEYEGKTQAARQKFEFADYAVYWSCAQQGGQGGRKPIRFQAPMFLTEGPHQGTRKPVHQITVDLLELVGGLEEVFSTHLLWNRDSGQLKFDSGSVKKFIKAQPAKVQEAATLHHALTGAVEMAAGVWTNAVWAALEKKSTN